MLPVAKGAFYPQAFNLYSAMPAHDLNVSADEYERIQQEIENTNSPVGIDAKKTHVLILHKLLEIEKRLDEMAKRMEEKG